VDPGFAAVVLLGQENSQEPRLEGGILVEVLRTVQSYKKQKQTKHIKPRAYIIVT
jgi:hypothetical protein